jgi:hypothetical protein
VRAHLALTAALALACWGCSGSAIQQGPSDALRAYAKALDAGRPDDAYKLLSTDAKQRITAESFRRMVQDNSLEMREIAHALSRPASDPVITAAVTSPKGDTLLFVYEGGRWKLDSGAINLYGQTTPRRALEAFLRAFERRRYDVLLRFVPDGHREGLDEQKLSAAWEGPQKEEMLRITAGLRAALPTAQIEEIGERATLPYGSGARVQFVREHGVWKIEDFD